MRDTPPWRPRRRPPRNVEHRIPGVGATARRDRRFEFAHRDIGGIDVLAHRFEQTGEVIGRTVRRRGIGTGEVVPQTRVEQQIAIDHHGDAIGIRTVRRIAVMFLWLSLFHHMLFLLGHVHLRCGPCPAWDCDERKHRVRNHPPTASNTTSTTAATMASLRRPATSTSGLRACTALSLYLMALPLFLLMLHITLNVQDYLMAPYAICQDVRFLYRI